MIASLNLLEKIGVSIEINLVVFKNPQTMINQTISYNFSMILSGYCSVGL